MCKPEIRLGKDDIRHCHFCKYWDADVYKWDIYGRKKLVHEGAGRPDEQDEEDGDGFIWYGKKYKWDFIKETIINDKH